MKNKYTIHICWLYPDLMSTYGDRGNIIILQKRGEWRGISVFVTLHSINSPVSEIENADLLFMGGAQDRQQELVSKDLFCNKKIKMKKIQEKVENNIPGLYICGAYQSLGNYYLAADGTKIPGLGIFDMYTEHSGDQKKRLIGNIIIKPNTKYLVAPIHQNMRFVGFENHGGRTYLGKCAQPFAKVVKGFGNNGEDGDEGIVYKNSIGTYLHGPMLSKNPEVADWLIQRTLEKKYQKNFSLAEMEDLLEKTARAEMIKKSL